MSVIKTTTQQHQGVLVSVLDRIFPHQRVITEARREASIVHPITGKNLEVDVWYPDINLSFEYQDDYHYVPTWYSQKSLTTIQETDYIKQNALLQREETFVVVPYWWDGLESSLRATISFHRPDLISDTNLSSSEIPFNPPSRFLPEHVQLMLASFPLMETIDLIAGHGWWMGEKYDGVRCYWDPSKKALSTRTGTTIEMLSSVKSLFGNIVLDGEIWCGKGFFLESQYLFRANLEKSMWAQFRVICFDEASKQLEYPFEKRYSLILSHYHSEHPTIIVASRFLLKNISSLNHLLQQIIESGGEGIILRKIHSLYISGRSPDLIKLKASRGDQEALVVQVENDGTLLLQLPDSSQIVVPKSRCILHRRVTKGDIVTFTFSKLQHPHLENEIQSGNLQSENLVGGFYSPTVFRIRDDVAWEDIVKNSPISEDLKNIFEQNEKNIVKKQQRYWKDDKDKSKKRFHLEHIAKLNGFDPLVAENWYNISRKQIAKHKEGRSVLRMYPEGLVAALVDLFPELSFTVSKFSQHPRNYYLDNAQNRRELLERFARSKGQDPLNPHFWYSVKMSDYNSFKAMKTVISHYGALKTAVTTIFPEIKFDLKNFSTFPSPTFSVGYWKVVENRRALFCELAKKQKFDPLIPSNWYSLTYHSIAKHHKLASGILRSFYGGNIKKGLLDMFPDIGLVESKFNISKHNFKYRRKKINNQPIPKIKITLQDVFPDLNSVPVCHWKDPNNIRAVFNEIANKRGFDPLFASNWYSVTHSSLRHLPVFTSPIRGYYGGSLTKALLHLFPNLGLDESKLRQTTT